MKYITSHTELMGAIGIVLVFVVGGKLKMKITKEETDVEAGSEGALGKILNFLSKRKQQDIEVLRVQHEILKERLIYELPKEITNLPEPEPEKITDLDTEKKS
jgi:hypothetical protein